MTSQMLPDVVDASAANDVDTMYWRPSTLSGVLTIVDALESSSSRRSSVFVVLPRLPLQSSLYRPREEPRRSALPITERVSMAPFQHPDKEIASPANPRYESGHTNRAMGGGCKTRRRPTVIRSSFSQLFPSIDRTGLPSALQNTIPLDAFR